MSSPFNNYITGIQEMLMSGLQQKDDVLSVLNKRPLPDFRNQRHQ